MPAAGGPAELRVGLLAKRGRFMVAEPFFERGRQMTVDGRRGAKAGPGDLALLRPARSGGRGRVEVVRTIGRPDNPRAVIEALLCDRGYERGFRDSVESEATAAARGGAGPAATAARGGSGEAATAARGGSGEGRRDLTDLATFTIDPVGARDFDDAISAERDGDGVRVCVHIADVSAFVRPGSALDREALERGNSVYVPGTVEPMLPKALSNEACSLVPGSPRPVVTVDMRFDGAGRVLRSAFHRSLIRSDARLDYEQVDRAFAGTERVPDPVAEPLSLARQVADHLWAGRMHEGAVGIETYEPEFEFDAAGHVIAARDVLQTESHRVIEQLMVCANEQVAMRLEAGKVPTVFRVHEQPDPVAIEFLVAQLASLEVPTPALPERMAPREAGAMAGAISARLLEYLESTGGRGRAALTSLVLRSLKQAVYSPLNIGHAGLASAGYCHFTSPIRRYPDLVAHRSLLSTLGAEQAPAAHELDRIAAHCSATEREATDAERKADDVCLSFLLERELSEHGWDERFEGEVTGVIGAGAFVAFRWKGIGARCEGLLPVRRMGDDWYDMNEERTMLVGRRSGRRLRLGDPVEVTVRSVDAPRGQVDLEPAGDER